VKTTVNSIKIKSSLAAVVAILLTVAVGEAQSPAGTFAFSEADWPWWRGSNRDGIAAANQQPPVSWDAEKNIRWRAAIPGRGHGSPTLLGDRVLIATADHDQQKQLVLCFDRDSGKLLWQAVVHEGGFDNKSKRKTNNKASLASSTVATDSERLFINFLNDSAVWTTALDLDGNILWQQKVSDYIVHQGYGSSPAVYEHLVIVSADNKGGGAIAGLNRTTGEIEWRRSRPEKPNYASPAILNIAGRDQLILTGCDLVTSLDPLTGDVNWEIEGATTECVTTAVSDGTHVFTSGGYPKDHIAAVMADGSGRIAWESNTRAYVPSLLQRDGFLYATLDAGVASCFRCDTGEEVWKARLGGTFSSSPVLVGDQIYATNEEGETHIFRADPNRFERIATNQLGQSVFATPVICGSRIYMRVAHDENGNRQEYLYCIGK
jgi:outer membrane protein assembly factor BamB